MVRGLLLCLLVLSAVHIVTLQNGQEYDYIPLQAVEDSGGGSGSIMSIVGVFAVTAEPEWQEMTTQGYPDPYPNDASFAWQINAEQETDLIVLQLRDIHLGSGDILTIYDGRSFMDPSVRIFRGQLSQAGSTDFVVSSTNHLYITLQTDSSGVAEGFSFNLQSIQQTSVPVIRLLATSSVQTLTSPGYPNDSAPIEAKYVISTQGVDKRILLVLDHIHLSPGDRLAVHDGFSPDLPIRVFTGPAHLHHSTDYLMSSSPRVDVSTQLTEGGGDGRFSIHFSTVERGEDPLFELVAMDDVRSLTSPNYPLYYPRDLAASWLIQSGGLTDLILIKFRVIALDIEDQLFVYDGSSSADHLLREITGPFSEQESADLLISSTQSMLIMAGARVVRGGGAFHIDYSLVPKSDAIIVQVLVSDETISMTSPNYPYHTPAGVSMIWEIETTSVNNTVFLQFEELYLGSGDEVTVYENKSELSLLDVHSTDDYRQMAGNLSLDQTTDFVRSRDHSLYVSMDTRSEVEKRLKMKLTSLPKWEAPVIELIAMSTEQHLTSPNFPRDFYPREPYVTWIIRATTSDNILLLKLTDIQLAMEDSLHIYDSVPGAADFHLLRNVSGPCDFRHSSDFLLSFSSGITVVFEGHSEKGNLGFNLIYSEVAVSVPLITLEAASHLQVLLMPLYDPGVQQTTITVSWHIKVPDPGDNIALLIPYNELDALDKINMYDNSLLKSYIGNEVRYTGAPNQSELVVASTGELYIQSELSTTGSHQKRFYYYIDEDQSLFAVSALTSVQELMSPGYPGNFPSDFPAYWLINSLYAGHQVILHLREMRLAVGDTVTIYDGFGDTKQELHTFSGPVSLLSATDYLRSTHSEMSLGLTASSATGDKRFRFLYNSVAVDEFYEEELQVSSAVEVVSFPGYLGTYQQNTQSAWTLTSDQPDQIVVLHFPHVHLSDGDELSVYDGPDDSSDLLLTLTGHSHTKDAVESSGQAIHVQLHTLEDSPQDQGFEMIYYMAHPGNLSTDIDPCLLSPCPVTHVCEQLMDTYACKCPPLFVGDQCTFRCDYTPADVAFLLDSSRSISESNWAKVVEFVSSIVETLEVRQDIHRIGVLSFAANATVDIYFDDFINDTEAIINTLQELPYKDSMTNIAGAIRLMKSQLFKLARGDREGVKNIAVLITDGEATMERDMTRQEANRAKFDENVLTLAVAIGSSVNLEELYNFVSKPVTKYLFRVENFDYLDVVTNSILSTACVEDLTVLQGEEGDAGDQGVAGEGGRPGERGAEGQSGQRGQAGQQGERGESNQGATGQVGSTGDMGAIGPVGGIGAKGDIGATGSKGRMGPNGMPGMRKVGEVGSIGGIGPTGEPGMPGPSGSVGILGQSGGAGTEGIRGEPGNAGVPGYPGSMGGPGEQGVDGNPGARGPPGQPPLLDEYRDANQCAENTSLCEGTCVDLMLGYRCDCPEGFTLDDDCRTCNDIDECAVENGGCEQMCRNSLGSFQCYCGRGFTLSLDTVTCLDVDECCSGTILPVCRTSEICVNTFGGYACLSKRIAFYPVKKRDKDTDFLMNRFGDVLMSRPFFIGLIVWLTVLTLLYVLLYCLVWASDTQDIMDVLRDRLHAEEEVERHNRERFRRMTSQEAHNDYVFPRMSLRGDVEQDHTDNTTYRPPFVPGPTPDRKKSIMKKTLADKQSLYLDPYRRNSRVTIQSPGGHVIGVKDTR